MTATTTGSPTSAVPRAHEPAQARHRPRRLNDRAERRFRFNPRERTRTTTGSRTARRTPAGSPGSSGSSITIKLAAGGKLSATLGDGVLGGVQCRRTGDRPPAERPRPGDDPPATTIERHAQRPRGRRERRRRRDRREDDPSDGSTSPTPTSTSSSTTTSPATGAVRRHDGAQARRARATRRRSTAPGPAR